MYPFFGQITILPRQYIANSELTDIKFGIMVHI